MPIKPSLPDQDPNPADRRDALRRSQEDWSDPKSDPPRAARPRLSWLAKVGRYSLDVVRNGIAVHLGGSARTASVGTAAAPTPHPAIVELEAEVSRLERALAHEAAAPTAAAAPLTASASASAGHDVSDDHDELAALVGKRLGNVYGAHPPAATVVATASASIERAEAVEDFERLFRVFDEPPIIAMWGSTESDDMFAWLRVAGPNPNVLQVARAGTGPGGLAMSLTDEQLRRALHAEGDNADTTAQALAEGRLFIADYTVLRDHLEPGTYQGAIPKTLCAPRVLFGIPKKGERLRPVTIQVAPQDDDAFLVFPHEGDRWRLAKAMAQVADGNHHELISHLGRTHLAVEPFLFATARQLAPAHPLRVLLMPHFEGSLFINNSARGDLIAPGGAVDQIFAGTVDTAQSLATWAASSATFSAAMLPSASATETIVHYPYRDDARLIWDELERWLGDYVTHVYIDDDAVARDTELAAWWDALLPSTRGNSRPTTRRALAELLTAVVFTASAQHAAVNFPQWPYMSFAPAIAGAGWGPALAQDEAEVDLERRLGFMPPIELAKLQADTLYLLGNVHHTKLGDYDHNRFPYRSVFRDEDVHLLLATHRHNLERIERTIEHRNEHRWRSYDFLRPSRIPMSINI